MVRAGARKTKTRGRGKAPRRRGATTGGVESEKRDKGGSEEKTGKRTVKVSGGGETIKGGSREAEEGRGGTAEAKRDGRCLPSESRSTSDGYADTAKKLVEENESRTSGISSVRGGDEPD